LAKFQMIQFGVLVIIIVMALLVFFYTRKSNQKRAEAIKHQSQIMDFAYQEKVERGSTEIVYSLSLFLQGHSRKTTNIMSGNYNHLPVTIADYQYVTGSGKNSSTHKQTFFIINSAKIKLPVFKLQPENMLHKIADIFGQHDIDFESYPQFSKQYHLKGEDAAAIRALFLDSIINYFESHPGLTIEASDNNFLFYRGSKLVQPEKLQDFLQQGYDIYEYFKS
jgi:hypothetical protein